MEVNEMTKKDKIFFGTTEENLKHFIMNNEVKFRAILTEYPDLLKRFVKLN